MPMDNNRIKPVSPSVARLRYESNRNNQKQKKKPDKDKKTQKPAADDGNVIDDFA